MSELEKVLVTAERWALAMKLDEDKTSRVITEAWFRWKTCKKKLPPSAFARWAVRKVLAGNDLPGCGTSIHDALRHATQGAGMNGVLDREPPPDVLASKREAYERLIASLSPSARAVARLRQQGISNSDIARTLKLSESRTSQLAREIKDEWERQT